MRKKSNRLAEANRKLLENTAALKKEIELLQHDKAYLEKVAREKYGMLKRSEEVYYLSPEARRKE